MWQLLTNARAHMLCADRFGPIRNFVAVGIQEDKELTVPIDGVG
jgi:hypothetical protein